MTSVDAATSGRVAARDLRVVLGRLVRRLREVTSDDGLSLSAASVLSRLTKEGPASASDLAAAEGVRPQSMAATVLSLEDRGLVARSPDLDDGRRLVVSLTREGEDTIEGRRAVKDEWLARAMQDRYSESERRTIIRAAALLDRLVEP